MAGVRILVVEDEPGVRQMTLEVLMALDETYETAGVGDAQTAIQAVQRYRPDLVLLDLNLGQRFDGLDVCRAIRDNPETAHTAVIILTAERANDAEPMLLDAGADDYIRKPLFTPQLLASRVRAVLRRTRNASNDTIVRHGPLIIDPERREALLDGQRLALTPTEFDILLKLARHKDRALRRNELLDRGGSEEEGGRVDRTVDVHVLSIRRKLGRHDWIVDTVFGIGYRLGVPPSAEAS
jgi:DNA-binding response OmpR family regulator